MQAFAERHEGSAAAASICQAQSRLHMVGAIAQ